MTHMECKECEIRYYQDRLNQLQHENSVLKSHTCFQPTQPIVDPLSNSIFELNAQNQRLVREAEMYQSQIKRQLTSFIRESNLLKECSFRRKYIHALSFPPQKLLGLRR